MEPRHRQLGMTDDELAAVIGELGREPTDLQLAMYSVMWSEHCSYKSSRPYLSRFLIDRAALLLGPGEGAGVVDIGDGIVIAIRIESHNHPSAVEPYQGAATGVGGIIRDIFSMACVRSRAHGPAAVRLTHRRTHALPLRGRRVGKWLRQRSRREYTVNDDADPWVTPLIRDDNVQTRTP